MSLVKWPGLIDVHVHLRDPGAVYKEDFLSGSRAAIKGGFTHVFDMPNNPVPTITLSRVERKIKLASKKSSCQIGFHMGTNGKNMDEFEKVWDKSQVFGLKIYFDVTTGEMMLTDLGLLVEIFKAWKSDKPILAHAEGFSLAGAIALAKAYKRRLHVCHVSRAEEVELIKLAKKQGQKITAGVTPHHLFLIDKDVDRLGGVAMMKPSLGSVKDQKSLWQGLKSGVIDVVESDHAPHTRAEKTGKKISFGVPGLETTLGLMLLAVKQGKVSLAQVKKWLHDNPKKIFHVKVSNLNMEYIEFDPDKSFIFKASESESKCDWSPFDGMKLYGQVEKVVINERQVYVHDSFL